MEQRVREPHLQRRHQAVAHLVQEGPYSDVLLVDALRQVL